MPNNNNLIIENKAPIEEIRELENQELITLEEQTKIVNKLIKNEIPSYEEFMKTYESEEGVADSYYYEIDSYGDMRVVKCYGPGFWDDIKGVVKPIATGALVAASIFPPTAAVAAPVTYFVIGAGVTTAGAGHLTNNEEVKEFGKDLVEIGMGANEGQDAFSSPRVPLHQYALSRNRN